MEEKKYAFYAQGNGRIKTMEDLLQHGDLKQIRLAEISQEYGDDVSAHGTPIYETITHLKDVESDEQYTVYSHDLFKRAYVFAETDARKLHTSNGGQDGCITKRTAAAPGAERLSAA